MNSTINTTESKKQELLSYIKQFGTGSLAYSALQEGLNAYRQEGYGFLAHAPIEEDNQTTICLSDPICAPHSKKALLEGFVRTFMNPLFLHISRETAEILHSMGFYVNEMGTETIIDVQKFSLSGHKKEYLRLQRNHAHRDNIQVIEPRNGEVSVDTMRAISDAWLKHKVGGDHELSLIMRPIVYEEEPDVRHFFAIQNDTVIGFVFFDPMYRDGKVIGYLANFLRTSVHTRYSICDFIILEAIAKFKSEGIEVLSLGFSPFADINDSGEFRFSKPLKTIFKYCFEKANYLYAFKQLSFHKQCYRPGMDGTIEVKVYCASKSKLPLHNLYICMKNLGIDPVSETAHHVFDVAKQRLTISPTLKPLAEGAMAVCAAAVSLLLVLTSVHNATARQVDAKQIAAHHFLKTFSFQLHHWHS